MILYISGHRSITIVKAPGDTQIIDVAFNSGDLVLEDLHSVIKELGKLTGCLNCGFNGMSRHLTYQLNNWFTPNLCNGE